MPHRPVRRRHSRTNYPIQQARSGQSLRVLPPDPRPPWQSLVAGRIHLAEQICLPIQTRQIPSSEPSWLSISTMKSPKTNGQNRPKPRVVGSFTVKAETFWAHDRGGPHLVVLFYHTIEPVQANVPQASARRRNDGSSAIVRLKSSERRDWMKM